MALTEEEKKKKQAEAQSAQEVKEQEKQNLDNPTTAETAEPVKSQTPAEKGVDLAQQVAERNSNAHPNSIQNVSGRTSEPTYTANELEEARQNSFADEPYLHSFLNTHTEPTEPEAYDERKEKALRWQEGITLLGKLAGVIGDTATAANKGVVTDKSEYQGQKETDAVGKQIGVLRDNYNKRYKQYLDEVALYRKGKQAAIDADIKARAELEKKLSANKTTNSFSWGDGFSAENRARFRQYKSAGSGSKDKVMTIPMTLRREATIRKDDMPALAPTIVYHLLSDLEKASQGAKDVNFSKDLLEKLSSHLGLPQISYDLSIPAEKRRWISQILQASHEKSAEATLTKMFVDQAAKGQLNYILLDYLNNTNNVEALEAVEQLNNKLTGRTDHGYLLRDEKSVTERRNALLQHILQTAKRNADANGKPTGGYTIVVNEETGKTHTFNSYDAVVDFVNGLDRDELSSLVHYMGVNDKSNTPGSTTDTAEPTEQNEPSKEEQNTQSQGTSNADEEDLKKNMPNINIATKKKRKDFIKARTDANGNKATFAKWVKQMYPNATQAEIDYAFTVNI